MKIIFKSLAAILIIAAIIIASVWIYQRTRDVSRKTVGSTTNSNESEGSKTLVFGNPGNAISNKSNPNNYLISGNHFAISYNRDKGIPNWVAWTLSSKYIGNVDRQNDFRPDTSLPSDWKRITPSDYSRSGYTRGHLCPSADRSSSIESNSATFLMSNITPQTYELNVGPWEKLEKYSRSLARRNTTLQIIAGHYGDQGRIKNKFTIPTNFWKIVIVIPNGSKIDRDSRVIVVDMPNINGIEERNWRDFRTTIAQIEQKTGYKFLTNLPLNVQNTLKSKEDTR